MNEQVSETTLSVEVIKFTQKCLVTLLKKLSLDNYQLTDI